MPKTNHSDIFWSNLKDLKDVLLVSQPESKICLTIDTSGKLINLMEKHPVQQQLVEQVRPTRFTNFKLLKQTYIRSNPNKTKSEVGIKQGGLEEPRKPLLRI